MLKNERGERVEMTKEIEASLNSHFSDILKDSRMDHLDDIESITKFILTLVLN